MEDYILILNKPKNISSFSYIQKIRKEENIKKIGHAGTLDPLAEGMMIVMANGATKFSDYLMKKDKTYLVEMELGYETDTLDLEGKKINEYKGEIEINIELLNEVLNKYKGKIITHPPSPQINCSVFACANIQRDVMMAITGIIIPPGILYGRSL